MMFCILMYAMLTYLHDGQIFSCKNLLYDVSLQCCIERKYLNGYGVSVYLQRRAADKQRILCHINSSSVEVGDRSVE